MKELYFNTENSVKVAKAIMKELYFNTENIVKVAKAMASGLVTECARDMLSAKITGEQPDLLLGDMAKSAMVFVGILTKETDFREALKFLSERGVTIE